MVILSATDIKKSYGDKDILNKATFFLDEYDKVGFIGVNGAGKSTFLRLITGDEFLDEGSIVTKKGLRISVLDQEPVLNEKLTILENIFLDTNTFDRQVLEYEAKTILNKMGFSNFDLDIKTLSGGERKRIALAKTLVIPTDLIILDEPTNHLDNDMILWLEDYLKNYSGAVIMVTHDRYFLDRVANKILELDDGQLYTYNANYSKFLELKLQREESELATKRKNRSLYEKELEWSKRGPRGRGTKSQYRLDRLQELDTGKVIEDEKLTINTASTRLGKKTIEIENICKSYGDRVIVKDFTYIVDRNERLGIVGANGKGKSTLLNMMSLQLKPDSGTIEVGETVKIGIVNQNFDEPPAGMRVIDYIKDVAEFVKTDTETITASSMLERFLFDKNKQWTTVEKLSGGEKRRLNLLRVLMSAPNILFLDEPTNDLDIMTLQILEEYLESFNGAVITVSHDRYFLDKVVDVILDFQTDATIRKYTGNYTDFLEYTSNDTQKTVVSEVKEKDETDSNKNKPRERQLKFSFNEKREFENIEKDIENLEKKIDELTLEMERVASEYSKLVPLSEQKEELENQLFEKLERFEYLTDLNDRINSQRG